MGPRDEQGIALVWLFHWLLRDGPLPMEFEWEMFVEMDGRKVRRKLSLIR